MLGIHNIVLDMTHIMLDWNNKSSGMRLLKSSLLLLMVISNCIEIQGQSFEPIKRINLVIELEQGINTDAQITFPSMGDGPFPCVLLVPGGGVTDMDEYMPPVYTKTGSPAGTFRQIAEYLSERGYMVLRYNKRGVERNATLVDPEIYQNATVEDSKSDAMKALDILKNHPLAKSEGITVVGHSESSIIVPRMAEEDHSIGKIVLLGAGARDYLDIKYHKVVELRVNFAEEVLDNNGDGMVSLSEAITGMEQYDYAIISKNDLLMEVGNETQWLPYWDPDGDTIMNITGEYKPVLEHIFSALLNPNYPGYRQVQALIEWGPTMDMIGGLNASILILQGEGDFQTPLIEALLLEQTLLNAEHGDHALITYEGLSHFFHPTDGWETALGPMESCVLDDMYRWLCSTERDELNIEKRIQNTIDEFKQLELELYDIENAIETQKFKLNELINRNSELENKINDYRTYIAVNSVVCVVAMILAAYGWRK